MKTRVFSFILALFAVAAFSITCFAESSLVTKTTTIQNKTRTYYVYQPEACKTKSCPLVIMFHGLGGDAAGAAGDAYGWKETADQNSFVAAFPESLTLPAKTVKFFMWSYTYDPAGKHWDIPLVTLSSSKRYCATCSQDVEFTQKMIGEIQTNFNTLSSHVFATGHSYGAFFSYFVSMCLPEIKAFASHSGGLVSYYGFWFPGAVKKATTTWKMPGLVLSSPGDTTVDHNWSITLDRELGAKGHPHELVKLDKALGHAWDKTKNQYQWDFFVKNSPALPAN